MKTIVNFKNALLLFICSMLMSVYSFAQAEGAKVNIDVTKTTTTEWYANPWVWVVGVAVFILLFAAIIRGGSKSDA